MFRPQVIDRLDFNGIINSDFDYWQRQTSWNPSLDGVTYGGPDRFCVYRNIGDAQITRSEDTPTYAQSGHLSKYSLDWSPNIAIASPTSAQYYDLAQCIEGNYVMPLAGQDVFLSFWVKSNVTGETAVNFRANSASQSYVASYTINQADTWEQKVIKLNFPSEYSWNVGTGRALFLSWNLIPEGDYSTTPNQWVSGNKSSYSGMNNFFSSTSNYFRLAQVKIGINYTGNTLDSVAYSYAGKNVFEELALCRRYYEKSYAIETIPGSSTGVGEQWIATDIDGTRPTLARFLVEKRVVPSISYPYSDADMGFLDMTAGNTGTREVVGYYGGGYGRNYHWEADAELS